MAQVQEIQRKFVYGKNKLVDIQGLSVAEIQDHYTRTYPELLNAKVIEKPIIKGVRTYEFQLANGSKG